MSGRTPSVTGGRAGRGCGAAAVAAVLLAACGGDGFDPPPPVPAGQLYWRLELNHRAALLSTTAPYDTLTLAATPRNVLGEALPAPAATYTSGDLKRLVVTPDGVLRAVGAGVEPVWVVAELAVGGLTHVDSLQVRIVDDPAPPVLADFSIRPVPPDSAKTGGGPIVLLPPALPLRAADAGGAPLADLPVFFESSDTTIALVHRNDGSLTPRRPGAVTFRASTVAFGVAKADTLPYRVGWPTFELIGYGPVLTTTGELGPDGFTPATVTVGVGALVQWGSASAAGVVFDEPGDLPFVAPPSSYAPLLGLFDEAFCETNAYECGAGHVALAPERPNAFRVFTAPGVYEFHSTANGAAGKVVVVDER